MISSKTNKTLKDIANIKDIVKTIINNDKESSSAEDDESNQQ